MGLKQIELNIFSVPRCSPYSPIVVARVELIVAGSEVSGKLLIRVLWLAGLVHAEVYGLLPVSCWFIMRHKVFAVLSP